MDITDKVTNSSKNNPRIIIALDFADQESAYALIDKLDPKRCRLKVGLQMFTHLGPSFIASLVARKFDVFLDLKFHDIPTTVANACYAASDLGVWMLDVHALGGEKMLTAARNAVDKSSGRRPLLIAITVLTSLLEPDLEQVGLNFPLPTISQQLACLAKNAGLDGVVCSPQEAKMIRHEMGDDFLIVTPGIRLTSDKTNDQQRSLPPDVAIKLGADFLVIGRPITQAHDPMAVLEKIENMMSNNEATL